MHFGVGRSRGRGSNPAGLLVVGGIFMFIGILILSTGGLGGIAVILIGAMVILLGVLAMKKVIGAPPQQPPQYGAPPGNYSQGPPQRPPQYIPPNEKGPQ